MAKRFGVLLTIIFSLIPIIGRADEGMWLLPLIQQLNAEKMQQMGLKLSAEDIYNINGTSLKDAVVALDEGACTAELVSPDGLMLTNHHCGYSEIQKHSAVDHDYLSLGFWAKSREEELPNPGKKATFLIRMEDVTDKILPFLTYDMSENERETKIQELSSEIEENAAKDTKYETQVQSFFEGNKFYLIVYQTFKDIRLVGAPPSSVGKFGGDTDNWMWPRHTGDFCMFRIYCAPDGSPADYSPSNVPFHPKSFLKISLNGIEKGDFTMILGYPGTTNRYMPSLGIKELQTITHPNRIKIRGLKQRIWMDDMKGDNKIRIQYADKYSSSSNYWKYSIGQKKGLTRLNVEERRAELEKEFANWMANQPERSSKYGNSLKLIRESYEGRKDYNHAMQYLLETFLYDGIEIVKFGLSINPLYLEFRNNPDSLALIRKAANDLRNSMGEFYKNYNKTTDMKVASALLKLYHDNVPVEFHLSVFETIQKKYKGDYDKYVADIFNKSILTDSSRLSKFLEIPNKSKLEKDPVYNLTRSFIQKYFEILDMSNLYDTNLNRGKRIYMAGLMEMQNDRVFYPDANSTMRLTYGTVSDYRPMDAVYYDFKTTLQGVMEKEDPENFEFNVDPKLKELYKNKDYGRYGEADVMPVCFITNNDITGGNSGSPVLNGEGMLIGLAFDGNWEAMTGDIEYEPLYQKCICVDIRYVLFVIDKLAGAGHLIKEMTLID